LASALAGRSTERTEAHPSGPLTGVTVVDACQLFAGPLISTILGDFGATVIKVEHPRGDPLRNTGYLKEGKGLWWKVVSRNKKCVTLDIGQPAGVSVFKRLTQHADIVLEGFRPGTMERWGVGWEVLHQLNPRLIFVRVSGFGQTGPYAQRPGFGTLAEAMSGFAHLVGEAGGPPTLPPFGLGDGCASLVGTAATMFALYHRDVHGGSGQVVDLSLYEGLMFVVGPLLTYYDQLGIKGERTGSRTPLNAPRNLYQTSEGSWVAVSATGHNPPRRIMELVGHPEYADEPWFDSARGRAEHADLLDAAIAPWISARSRAEVLARCEAIGAAAAPVYDASDLAQDPQINYRSVVSTPDPDFGTLKMQNVLARLSETPGSVRWTGPRLGEHNSEIFQGWLGMSPNEVAELNTAGII
jgi:crotonobetainyl-CoA:carnitine CoA-transferase CaiB-like acyl-CoA transferase